MKTDFSICKQGGECSLLRLKNRFSRLRTSRFFTQSFTLFILMMGLPVICLGIFSIVTQQEDANARIEEGYNNALENIVTGVESTFSNLSTLATQIPSIPWVEQYIYASDTRITYETLDQLALSDQIQELSVFKVTNNILNGIILSFDDKQFVISSYGRARSENFYGEFLQFGHYQADDWQTLFEGKKFMQMVGPYDSVIYSSSKRLLLCVTSLPAQERSCCAHLIFALDCDKLSAASKTTRRLRMAPSPSIRRKGCTLPAARWTGSCWTES